MWFMVTKASMDVQSLIEVHVAQFEFIMIQKTPLNTTSGTIIVNVVFFEEAENVSIISLK